MMRSAHFGPFSLSSQIKDNFGVTSFTYTHYRRLLGQLQKRGYQFAQFTRAVKPLSRVGRFVLLRHDIDMDLGKALQMARIEAECGVQATYFFLVRTDHYNLFSQKGSDAVRAILDLGHWLGLHFDCAAYPSRGQGEASPAETATHVTREARLLADWFGKEINVVSFHRPLSSVLSGDAALSAPLWHTYMKCFTEQVFYCSDSRGSFRYGHPLESKAFAEGRPLQLLTHPVWWSAEGSTPQESLRRLIVRQQNRFRRSLAENCQVAVGDGLDRAA